MDDRATASVVDFAELVATALGSLAVTLVGLGIESAAMANVLAGQTTLGLWEAVLGGLALYVGVYLLAYCRAWPKLRSIGAFEA